MDKKFKILMGLIITVILIIIIILFVLISKGKEISSNPNVSGSYIEQEEQLGDKPTVYANKILDNPTIFYTIEDCINAYLNAIKEQDANKVYSLLSEDYINNNGITVENVLTYVDNIEQNHSFIAIKMNGSNNDGLEAYAVEGIKDDGTYNEKMFFIVELDTNNSTNSITPLFRENYSNIEEIQEVPTVAVPSNENNVFKYNRVKDEDIIVKYMQYYAKLIQGNTQKAYELLDDEYKVQRFNNSYDSFVSYANEIQNTYNELNIVSYTKNTIEGNTVYNLKDQYERVYEINQLLPMQFTMKLDDYSIETEDFKAKYAEATNQVKAVTNVDKFMKMINNKDYEHAYNLFNETYKESNFNTLEAFIDYVENNFFEHNYYNISSVSQQGSYYIANVEIKNDSRVSADTITKQIIVGLGEGTEFTISIAL